MPAVSSVVMPEFERRSTDAARVRVVVLGLGALARQRLTAPLSLGAGLLAWPARRSRWPRPWLGCRRTLDVILLAAFSFGRESAERTVRRRRFRGVRRVLSQPLRKFDRHRMQPAQEFETRPRIEPLEKARFIAERLTGGLFDMPAKESDSRLPRQHFSPETAQSSQYTAPPRIRDCERFHASFALALSTGLSSTNNAFLG